MKILLLAAGYGTRLLPLTEKIPKCLVKINNIPLLSFWLRLLDKKNFEAIINTHYLSDVVDEYIISHPLNHLTVNMVHEDVLLGTAGTIRANRNFLCGSDFMVIHADNLSIFNIDDFIYKHKKREVGIEITMMVFNTDEPQNCGIVEIENDIVKKMHEKKLDNYGNIANGAIYLFSHNVYSYIYDNKLNDISTEVIPNFLGKIQVFHNNVYHRDIGNMESYSKANMEIKEINIKDYL
jgi:mannose-1-phosphate guanylyltransferase